MTNPVMISISGIRGIPGGGLSPELCVNYASAAGTLYGKGKVMVGRDSRITGEMVKAAVFSGLLSVGCHPIDLGICATPTVQMATKNSEARGGIVITASHNPVEWNGLKFLNSEGLFLDESEGFKLTKIIQEKKYDYVAWKQIGKIDIYDRAVEDHINTILKHHFINVAEIRKRRFRVAYDCVNGAGGTILPQLFERLGCQTIPLNEEPTGKFSHTPEPVPKNLIDLCKCVPIHNADIGFAVDPDVDRLALVAETGEPLGEEYTITLATQFILSKQKGNVVVNISTTRAVDEVAKKVGCSVIRTPVGEIHVAKKMKATSAVIGGEGNGGVILPDIHLGRDAPVAIVLILQHLLETGKKISHLWKSLPHYIITKKKLDIGENDPLFLLKKLEENHKSEILSHIDGLKIERENAWIHIRKSNTEPIIRVITEAKTKLESEALCDNFLEEMQKYLHP